VLVCGFVSGAAANPTDAQHAAYTDSWRGITFVSGLGTCPLFGVGSNGTYVLRDVDLTDHISSTYTPYRESLYQIDSVGLVSGLIHARSGTYTVGGLFTEHRIDQLAPRYFSGKGDATVSGPGGTVTGKATFQDLLDFPPQELDLRFTHITGCRLS
jgi:hypothetical protein